jgi:hypothetical protein
MGPDSSVAMNVVKHNRYCGLIYNDLGTIVTVISVTILRARQRKFYAIISVHGL